MRSPFRSTNETIRSKRCPQSPGRSITEVWRKRLCSKGRMTRQRIPASKAASKANKSAPHAAEQTNKLTPSFRSKSERACLTIGIIARGNWLILASSASIRRPASAATVSVSKRLSITFFISSRLLHLCYAVSRVYRKVTDLFCLAGRRDRNQFSCINIATDSNPAKTKKPEYFRIRASISEG